MYAESFFDVAPEYWEGSCHALRQGADGGMTSGLSYAEHFPYEKIPAL
jgi:hypothetical protein